MGFENYDFVRPVNHSGVIWVLWNNPHIPALVIHKEQHAIYMVVHDPLKQKNIIVSRVYGPT